MKIIHFNAFDGAVTGYIHESYEGLEAHAVRPALVVCPGGGYSFCSPRETDAPAMRFFSIVYNVFILLYSTGVGAYGLRPLRELAETVRILRGKQEEFGIDGHKIAVMGFSAAGHLAASLGALHSNRSLPNPLPENCRPDALVLAYPVITTGEYTHEETMLNSTHGEAEFKDLLSIENHITGDFPPAFLWHTWDDELVPLENTLMLAAALRKQDINFEYHVFSHGAHGLSTCDCEVDTPNRDCAVWIPLCQSWLNNIFEFEP